MFAVLQRPGSILELHLTVANLPGHALDADVICRRLACRRACRKAERRVAGQGVQGLELTQGEGRKVDLPVNTGLGVPSGVLSTIQVNPQRLCAA
jgi:hypothetical protein